MLQEFCRLNRKQVDIYFDNAPPGNMVIRKYGAVTAHFIRQGQTADAAIRTRLNRLGASAKNWTVVSSDQAVQASARAARARTISSDAFAGQVMAAFETHADEPDKQLDAPISAEEVDDWLRLFREKGNKLDKYDPKF